MLCAPLADRLDRLARSTRDLLNVLHQLGERGGSHLRTFSQLELPPIATFFGGGGNVAGNPLRFYQLLAPMPVSDAPRVA